MENIGKATFAAGCFWKVEEEFRIMEGVISTKAGYTGGSWESPTYEQVCSGKTGHAEAVQIEFDRSRLSFQDLLDKFWSIHDPTTLNCQGPDKGTQYRSVIFYHNLKQKDLAESSRKALDDSGFFNHSIVTEIVPAGVFYPAEEYHQHYIAKKKGK